MSARYSGAMHQIQQLRAAGISKSTLNTAYAAMTKRVTEPTTTEKLVREIQDLSDRAIAMDQSFERIKIELGHVDAAGYKNPDGRPLEKFQPTWVKFQQRFINLMWHSRSAASDAVSCLRDFVEALCPVLKDTSIPLERKSSALDEFIAQTKHTPPSKGETFVALRQDLATFSAKCISFINTQNVKLAAEIKALNDEIAALSKEIEECDKLVVEMATVLGGSGAGREILKGGIGLAGEMVKGSFKHGQEKRVETTPGPESEIAEGETGPVEGKVKSAAIPGQETLGAAAPEVFLEMVMTAVTTMISSVEKLVEALKEGFNARQVRQATQVEVNALNTRLQDLQALKSTLTSLEGDIGQTYTRLDDFSYIGRMVKRDAQIIHDSIEGSSELDKTMLCRIELMEAVYKALIEGLKAYATRVSESKVFQN